MKAFFIIALCALSSGCVYVHVPGKFTYISPAFGTKSIESVNLNTGELRGYKSEQSQMAEAIATGVAAGVAKGLK